MPKLPPPPRSARTGRGARMRTPDDAALGGDHFGGEQVVDREPVFAHEPADTTTNGESADAGVAHDAAGGGQAVDLRLVVDVAPQGASLHQAVRLPGSTRRRPTTRSRSTIRRRIPRCRPRCGRRPAPRSLDHGRGHNTRRRPRRRSRCTGRSAGGAGRLRRSTRLASCHSRRGQR